MVSKWFPKHKEIFPGGSLNHEVLDKQIKAHLNKNGEKSLVFGGVQFTYRFNR